MNRFFVLGALALFCGTQMGGCKETIEKWTGDEEEAPANFDLVSPSNGAVDVTVVPTFSWNSADEAGTYRLEVSTSSTFSPLVVDQGGITGTSVELSGTLGSFTTYFWRVFAVNDEGTSSCNAAFTFLTADGGELDSSFSLDGIEITPTGSGQDEIAAIAVQSDGKIVAAGRTLNGGVTTFMVARYTTTGALDTTFAGDGVTTTAIGSVDDAALAVAIQADGKIIAAGYSWNGANYDFALVRYTTSGTLDLAFDTDGRVSTPIGTGDDRGRAVLALSGGLIVVGGTTFNGTETEFGLARYTSTGALDTTFSGDGLVATGISGGDDVLNALAVQVDGMIVAVGQSGAAGGFALARYDTTGALDPLFDGDGTTESIFSDSLDTARAVVIQPDGAIVIAGSLYNGTNKDIAVARYLADGSPDATFDTDGVLTTPIGMNDEEAFGVALQANGRIVVGGAFNNGFNLDFAVLRYTTTGALDGTFDVDGKFILAVGIGADSAASILVQSDGRIVAAGSSFGTLDSDFALIRLLP